jgi:hypothetical protein
MDSSLDSLLRPRGARAEPNCADCGLRASRFLVVEAWAVEVRTVTGAAAVVIFPDARRGAGRGEF